MDVNFSDWEMIELERAAALSGRATQDLVDELFSNVLKGIDQRTEDRRRASKWPNRSQSEMFF